MAQLVAVKQTRRPTRRSEPNTVVIMNPTINIYTFKPGSSMTYFNNFIGYKARLQTRWVGNQLS